jgi:low affinity Fe/Cu permease
MGDFNIDMLKSESCTHASRFTEQFFTSSSVSLITKPTTLIDNIFTNNIDKIDQSLNGIIFSDLSDHLPIVHICNLEDSKEYNNQANNDNIESDFKRIINNKNINSFINEINC